MIVADDRRVEFRVSVTPCLGGEKVVLRIVAPHANLGHLDPLIPNETAFDFAHDILESPSGLVLVTGPTGSGKTTTLYAALRMIESRDHTLNIVTIEDPVEYNLELRDSDPGQQLARTGILKDATDRTPTRSRCDLGGRNPRSRIC